jgi:protein-disulfide isomerase
MISRSRSIALFLLLLAFPLMAVAGGNKKNTSPPVATVGAEKITEAELNTAIGNKLFRVRSEEYSIRRNALDEIITERLLRKEAARRGVSYEDFLEAEVESKVTIAPAAEMETFYEAMRDRFAGLSKEQALAQMADNMRRQQRAKRMAELVSGLRSAENVTVLLEPPRAAVAATGPSRGSDNAPVTVIAFSDYECTFCGRSLDTMKKLQEKYGQNVRIVHRDFPLASHRGAPKAAEAARCAGDQDKFWQMHEKLFVKGGSLGDVDLRKAATAAELDMRIFESCMSSGKYVDAWKADRDEGAKVGVTSTPTFFVNGRMILGAAGYDQFAHVIDEELKLVPAATSAVAKAAPATGPSGR